MIGRREWLHRMGVAAAMPMVSGLLPAELVLWGREVHEAAQAQESGPHLDAALMHTLAAACERVIPTDDTPGAIAAGVPRFIDHMLANWYDPPELARVVAGLQELNTQCRARFGQAFDAAGAAGQDELLLALDALGGQSWFATVKYLTIWGYYTSETGVTQELQPPASGGRYDGCAPYAPRARASSRAQYGPAAAPGSGHAAD